MTFAEYLALERDSEVKHEFDAGEVLPRDRVKPRHSALAARIIAALGNARLPGCTVFDSNLRVRVAATGRASYPDASMLCGAPEYDPEDAERTTIVNPTLLVEVQSDRGNHWMHYQRIHSLQEYVLVSHDLRIEIYRRTTAGIWEHFEVREGTVKLASGPTLDLAMLYADLPL